MMLPRLLRVLYPSFSRAPRITTAPLRSKTWNALLSSARRYYPGHRGGRWVTVLDPSRIPSNQKKGRGVVVEATPLSENDYYSVVERCFDIVMDHAATAQEEGSSITLEHLNDVLTITAPGVGDYILKRQLSTKQIWLCSPISESRSYDWVADSYRHYADDHDTRGVGLGQWLYLRDGTFLSAVLNIELGLRMEHWQIC